MDLAYVSPLFPSSPGQSETRGLARRARVRRLRRQLDLSLAGGADPSGAPDLKLRAGQLLDPQTREEIAKGIERLVELADRESGKKVRVRDDGKSIRVPICREKIWAARPLLVELSERVRRAGADSLRGIAMASVLLADGGGPLYDRDRSLRLQRAVQAALRRISP
jgi:hypothetical protein